MDKVGSEHHVVTYVGGQNIGDDGRPMEAAFLKTDLSVNWLEYFDPPKSNQVDRARRDMSRNLHLGSTGCLAELNVGESRRQVKETTDVTICFEKDPQPGNPSHCEARGMPIGEGSELRFAVAAALAESVLDTHPTRPPSAQI